MTRITVTRNGESTSPIIWTDMVPWVQSAMNVHVRCPGGDGAGWNFSKGRDNAVCTLHGRTLWTAEGEAMFNKLAGSRLTIDNGVKTRTGLAGTPTVQTGGRSWIQFSISVTED